MKAIVTQEEYEGLHEVVQGEYVQGEDERYYAKIDPVDGWEFQNVANLKKTKNEERERREKWERKHNELASRLNGVDPKDLEQLDTMKKELDRLKKLPDEAAVNERLKTLESEYAQKLVDAENQRTQDVSQRDARIKSLVVGGESRRLLAAAKCLDPDLFVDKIDKVASVGDGDEVVVLDSHGDPLQTKKPGAVGNMKLDEYVEVLKEQFPRNFAGANATGGGGNPNGAGGAGLDANPTFNQLDPVEQLKAIRRAKA